jgi:hypothetical protein
MEMSELVLPFFFWLRLSTNRRQNATTANVFFSLLNFDRFEEANIHDLPGPPHTGTRN